MKDEYARVGVPMMPVVHGETETRRQIVLYTGLLFVLTLLPVVFGFFGAIYATAAVALGAAFLVLAVRLQRRADRRSALRTYLFSLALPRAAVLRHGGRRPLVDSAPHGPQARTPQHPHRADRRDDHAAHVRAHVPRRGPLHRLMAAPETDAPPVGEEIHLPEPSLVPILNAVGVTLIAGRPHHHATT